MSTPVVMHVVVKDGCRSALVAALVGRFHESTKVVGHSELADAPSVRATDLIIVDLGTIQPVPLLTDLPRYLDRATLWLLTGDVPVHPVWLALIGRQGVRLVECDGRDRATGYGALLRCLAQHLAGPAAADVTRLVLEQEPALRPVEALIRAICERPWEVRRLRDLARATGITTLSVRHACARLGFERVEHFITIVRVVALEQLVAKSRLPISLAHRAAGVADPANFRRQVTRAHAGSRTAPSGLPTLRTAAATMSGWAALLLLPLVAACPGELAQAGRGATVGAASADSALAIPAVGGSVRRGDLVLLIRTTGQVRAERQVSLKGETQGTVQAVLVRPGDRVDGGQVVVQLDTRPFDLAVREAESQVEEARGRYRDILLGEDTTDTAPGAVERRRNARLRTGVDGAEARLERAQLDLERATMRAPFAGTVDQVQAMVGQRVGAGDPIATVVDLGSLIVEAAVLEHDLPLVRRGATAVVSVAASGHTFLARVLAVLPLVDTTTRSGRALVRVTTGDGVLRPGMYADVEIEATRLSDRVIVPAAAIIERDGRPLVFRYHAGRAEWVYVTPGRSNGRETEILPDSAMGRPAVAAGDTVLVEGHITLTHDALVRLVLPRESSLPR